MLFYYFVAFRLESPLFEDCGPGIFKSVKLARSASLETYLCHVLLPAWESLLHRLPLVADLIRLSLIIVLKGDVDGMPTAGGTPGKALPVHY